MQHGTATPVAPSLLRHAVRVLLLLAGLVVFWLLLCGSPAQADAEHGTRTTVGQVAGNVHRLVTPHVRKTPAAASAVVRKAVAPAPAPVRTVTGQTLDATEPRLETVMAALADEVDRTTRRSAAILDEVLVGTPLAPVLAPAQQPTAPITARAQHERAHPAAADAPPFVVVSSPDLATADQYDTAAPDLPADGPTFPLPDPTAPGSPSGVSGASAPPAWLGVAVLLAPVGLRRRRLRDGDAVPGGPTYLPGSSPD